MKTNAVPQIWWWFSCQIQLADLKCILTILNTGRDKNRFRCFRIILSTMEAQMATDDNVTNFFLQHKCSNKWSSLRLFYVAISTVKISFFNDIYSFSPWRSFVMKTTRCCPNIAAVIVTVRTRSLFFTSLSCPSHKITTYHIAYSFFEWYDNKGSYIGKDLFLNYIITLY